MTAAPASNPLHAFASQARGAFRQFAILVARIGLGIMLVIMAGFIAVATAMAGLAIAAVALFMRFSGNHKPRTAKGFARKDEGDGVTLDARPTPRGWTVE